MVVRGLCILARRSHLAQRGQVAGEGLFAVWRGGDHGACPALAYELTRTTEGLIMT